jgi:hypothetical protein
VFVITRERSSFGGHSTGVPFFCFFWGWSPGELFSLFIAASV